MWLRSKAGGGGGCPRARLGPTEGGCGEPCLSTKGGDQRTRPAGSLPVPAPLPSAPSLGDPPGLPVHRLPRLLVGRSIRSLSGSGQQLAWRGSELGGESAGMMYDGSGQAFTGPHSAPFHPALPGASESYSPPPPDLRGRQGPNQSSPHF